MAPGRAGRPAPRLTRPRWLPLGWTAGILVACALATGSIVATILWRTNALLTGQVLQVIAAESRGFDEQYRIGGLPLLVQAVSERAKSPGTGLYLLMDGNGNRLAGNLESYPAAIREAPAGGLFRYGVRAAGGVVQQHLAIGLPIRVGTSTQPPAAHLLIARDVDDINAFASVSRAVFLAGIGLVSLLALGGTFLYGRAMRDRIDAVTAASQRIMAGDLGQRLPLAGNGDEIDRLSASLNVMLGRIEQLLGGLREVSDNIAHDLKTPLTRLRNRAEAALRDGRGAMAYREGLERTLEEADEIINTFNALLSIARLEAGTGTEQMQPVDLATIVRDTVELYEPVAEEAGLRIVFERADTGLLVKADRQLIGQAVVNLIENAMKYGTAAQAAASRGTDAPMAPPDATRITVTIRGRDDTAEIVVADHGPGIPIEDRERVLKRFVRLDSSRTRPGTGLGLSLVAAVARIHQGSLRLEDNAPGLRVVLTLPRYAAHERAEHPIQNA